MPAVRLKETATGREIHQLTGDEGSSYTLAFSPDGRTLIWGSALWEVATGQKRRNFPWHEGYVNCVAFSANGQLLASGGSDAFVLIWDVAGKWGVQKPP